MQLKKLHPGENYAGEFCHCSLRIPPGDPLGDLHPLGILDIFGCPQTSEAPTSTAGRTGIHGHGDGGPELRMELQSPACRMADERARALKRVLGAEASKASKDASSMARDRQC